MERRQKWKKDGQIWSEWYTERVSPIHNGEYIKIVEERWPRTENEKSHRPTQMMDAAIEEGNHHMVRKNDFSKVYETNKIGRDNRIERQQVGNISVAMPNQDSSKFKTEEQNLNEELLANDSLGG